ncbi:YceH family protein [Marinomonas epiphytica]
MSYFDLSSIEMRVIGCLIEKEITTPDQYPLSLNSLTNACNQKSNREPVMNCSELDVQDALDALIERNLVTEISSFNSRVNKYQHRFCNTEFSDLQFSPAELAINCLLFLRGAQTPGELRSRSGRLHSFKSREESEQALQSLIEKSGGPYVHKLPRETGKREQRYVSCLMENFNEEDFQTAEPVSQSEPDLTARIEDLETKVQFLLDRVAELEAATAN